MYLYKDLTTVEKGVIVHGCNAIGGFGGKNSVATAISQKWPEVKRAYLNYLGMKEDDYRVFPDYAVLGTINIVKVNEDLTVVNAITQLLYGTKAQYANLNYILAAFNNLLDKFSDTDLYMPMIGCGYGGMDWKDLEPYVKNFAEKAKKQNINVYVCRL